MKVFLAAALSGKGRYYLMLGAAAIIHAAVDVADAVRYHQNSKTQREAIDRLSRRRCWRTIRMGDTVFTMGGEDEAGTVAVEVIEDEEEED